MLLSSLIALAAGIALAVSISRPYKLGIDP
jgi:hypothetical protein